MLSGAVLKETKTKVRKNFEPVLISLINFYKQTDLLVNQFVLNYFLKMGLCAP